MADNLQKLVGKGLFACGGLVDIYSFVNNMNQPNSQFDIIDDPLLYVGAAVMILGYSIIRSSNE